MESLGMLKKTKPDHLPWHLRMMRCVQTGKGKRIKSRLRKQQTNEWIFLLEIERECDQNIQHITYSNGDSESKDSCSSIWWSSASKISIVFWGVIYTGILMYRAVPWLSSVWTDKVPPITYTRFSIFFSPLNIFLFFAIIIPHHLVIFYNLIILRFWRKKCL